MGKRGREPEEHFCAGAKYFLESCGSKNFIFCAVPLQKISRAGFVVFDQVSVVHTICVECPTTSLNSFLLGELSSCNSLSSTHS